MKRVRIIAAALIVSMLFSMFSVGALAGPPTDAEFEFEAPDVVRVIVNYNHPSAWPGPLPPVDPRAISEDWYFYAPLGAPGVVFDLTGANPHAPDPTDVDADGIVIGHGWLRRGTLLRDVSRGSWGDAWGPWYPVVGGVPHAPFRHFGPGEEDLFPDPGPTEAGIFEFDYWTINGRPINRNTATINAVTIGTTGGANNPTVILGNWSMRRYVRIRHRFSGGSSPPSAIFELPLEQRPDGQRRMRVGDRLNLGAETTNLHFRFIGFDFFTFNGWTLAEGTENNRINTSHVPTLIPGTFAQIVTIPEPTNIANFDVGRLYFIANWRVVPPGTGLWVPPPQPEGPGGGGAGAGQQTSPPPPGAGVIGVGQMPPGLGLVDWDDYDVYGLPYYTAVPGTGGAPLIPIVTTFPAAVAPLPAPFTPTPLPEAPVVLEIPPIAVPIVGFDSNTWALMNLILAIIGALGAVATVIYVWRKNRNRREAGLDFEAEEESRKRRKQWLFAVGLVSIVSAVLFPLTQDMSNRMTLFDVWTIAHVVLFVAQGIAVWQIVRRKKRYDDGDGGNLGIAQANA